MFSDHQGIVIDPSGIQSTSQNTTIADKYGIRLSARQTPVYSTLVIYISQLFIFSFETDSSTD